MCAQQNYGPLESFETVAAKTKTKSFIKNRPRYFLVGHVMRKLVLERPSSRGLLAFAKVYPAIFTTLKSAFFLMPSASRLAEQLHGMLLRSFLTDVKAQSSHETTDQRQSYMLHHEYENRFERRKSVEIRIENRPKGGFRHEASKREQRMVSEQVMQSISRYAKTHLEHHLSTEQLNSVKTKDISKRGVRYKDIARDKAQNELAKEKVSRRKKPDKSIEDFKGEAESETVDNDADWVDFEQQELNLRRKELSQPAFWKAQDKQTLSRVDKAVFPGVSDPVKDTKAAYVTVITAYMKENDDAVD
jgi:hypothetical protein